MFHNLQFRLIFLLLKIRINRFDNKVFENQYFLLSYSVNFKHIFSTILIFCLIIN